MSGWQWTGLIIVAYLIGSELIAALIRGRRKWGGEVFHSNGCNYLPDGNWQESCVEHDKKYREGGWAIARLKADVGLLKGIWANGNPFAAILYFIGVRFGGMWAFQFGKKRELIMQ